MYDQNNRSFDSTDARRITAEDQALTRIEYEFSFPLTAQAFDDFRVCYDAIQAAEPDQKKIAHMVLINEERLADQLITHMLAFPHFLQKVYLLSILGIDEAPDHMNIHIVTSLEGTLYDLQLLVAMDSGLAVNPGYDFQDFRSNPAFQEHWANSVQILS